MSVMSVASAAVIRRLLRVRKPLESTEQHIEAMKTTRWICACWGACLGVVSGCFSGFGDTCPVMEPWTDAIQIRVPSIGTGRHGEDLISQSASLTLEGSGHPAVPLRRIWNPGTGAVWIGFDYPAYCVIGERIVGFRMVGRAIGARFSGDALSPGSDLDTIAGRFAASVQSLLPDESHDDVGVDLSLLFGREVLVGFDARPFPAVASISSVEAKETDVIVALKPVKGVPLSVTFDREWRPWKVSVDGTEAVVLGVDAYDPKARGASTWGPPAVLAVKSATGAITGKVRHAGKVFERSGDGRERQFMLVSTEGGRMWCGPSGTDIVLHDGQLVGFMVDDSGMLLACNSTMRVPLTRDAVHVFCDWMTRIENDALNGTWDRTPVVNVRDVAGPTPAGIGKPGDVGAIVAGFLEDGQLGLEIETRRPEGRLSLRLTSDLKFVEGGWKGSRVASVR